MEDINFRVDFVVGNPNKLQKLGLEGKTSWALNMFTLLNFKIFNFENEKKKECGHNWPNSKATLVYVKSDYLPWLLNVIGFSTA